DAGFIAVVCLIVFSSLYFFQFQVNTPNQDALEHSPQLFPSSSQLTLVIDSYANNNSQIFVRLSWNNIEGCKYFNLYRYGADPLSPTTENITLLQNASVSEYLDIPNIDHPYYMVRGYFENGSYIDSNVADVELGEIPMFINPEYDIEGNTVKFSVWCKKNVRTSDIFLLYRLRKDEGEWTKFEDAHGYCARNKTKLPNNWTKYEWYRDKVITVPYSTYVWYNFDYRFNETETLWINSWNYTEWAKSEPVYVWDDYGFSTLLLLKYGYPAVFLPTFIFVSIYFRFYLRSRKKVWSLTYLLPVAVLGVFYFYSELRFAIVPNSFEMDHLGPFGSSIDKYTYGLFLNRLMVWWCPFLLSILLGLLPFVVLHVTNLEALKQELIDKFGEEKVMKRGINSHMLKEELARIYKLYGWEPIFFLSILGYLVPFNFDILLSILYLILFIFNYIFLFFYKEKSYKPSRIFFGKIEKIDNFNHYWGELNQYYENCKKVFKLFRKMLIPVLLMFLALFISNYILFKNWLILMNT
ncbi:MAG: hypothetical protein ACTSVC_16930, partial [Promethearchaeota archaeon]